MAAPFFQETILFLLIVLDLFLAFWVLRSNPKKISNQVFASVVLAACLLSVFRLILRLSLSFLALQLVIGANIVLFALLTLFLYVYPDERPTRRGVAVILLPMIFLVLILPFRVVVVDISSSVSINRVVSGPALPFYIAVLFGYLGSSLYLAHQKSKRVKYARAVLFAVPFLIGATTCMVTASLVFGVSQFSFAPLIAMLVLMGGVAYTIMRYQFLDITVVIRGQKAYSIFFATFFAGFLALLWFLDSALGVSMYLSLFFAGVAIFHFRLGIASKYEQFTGGTFLKNEHELTSALRELSEIAAEVVDIDEMASRASKKLAQVLDVVSVEIGFKPHEAVGEHACFVYPIRQKDVDIGYICVEQRSDGLPLSRHELTLLKLVSYKLVNSYEKAKLHEQLTKYSEHLEEMVQERTREIEQMRVAEQQMFLDLSHGLQTPLTIMKGELQNLNRELVSSDTTTTLERSVDTVSRYLYNILELARFESGRDSFVAERIHFSALVDELLETYQILLEDKGIVLEVQIEQGLSVAGKRDDLIDMVGNLMSNAIKYIPVGQREKKITIMLASSHDTVMFRVRDTGIGIDQKDIEHIFSRFYRSARSSSEFQKGTGLGLSIVKAIVEKHGGSISVESVLGEWTEFTVQLQKAERPPIVPSDA